MKQTAKNVAVLTTSAQEADKEYTVTVDGEEVGKFTGIAAVIPTKITTTTTSLQGVIGNQVTVKAEVAVAEGQSKENIPVTFNIVNDKQTNDKIEVEVLTNAEGVATYSYTRYYESEDKVTAYATSKSSIFDDAKVYWANKIQLAVSEITTGNELANETKKSYKVTGEKNATYYVAIKENLNVAPDKVTQVKVQNAGSSNFVTPYELTTGGTEFATVTTNSNGEGTFTVYGSNLSATPIVYAPETTPVSTTATSAEKLKYNKLDLQAEAPTVKFSQINRLALTVTAEGTAEAAKYAQTPVAYNANSVGGRTYTVTVTDKDGKLASEGTTAYVTFEKDNISGDVYFSTGKKDFVKVGVDSVQAITVGKEGKATFRVAGTGATTFVKPTVFLNTAGDVNSAKLDKTGSTTDIYQVADVTYFKEADVKNAVLTVKDGLGANAKEITSATAGTDVFVKYQSVDQNGFAYKPTSTNYQLVFDVTSTFGNAQVKDVTGVALNSVQNLGNTKTYKVTADANGEAVIRVTSTTGDDVTVNVTGSNGILPTKTAKVTFTSTSTASVATGVVVSKSTDKIVIENKSAGAAYTYSYAAADVAQYQVNGAQVDEDAFKALLSTGDTVTAVQATDGKYILNLKDDNSSSAIQTQAGFNQALANGEKAFNLAITGDLNISTTETTTLTLNGTITGDVTVNAPNAHIVNNATINGNVKILDVAGSSFVNNGTITGAVTITDSNAKFENIGLGTVKGNIIIAGTGKQTITLLGTGSNNVVVGANVTELALLGTGSVYGSIVAESATTKVTSNGQSVSPDVVAGKGVENATITSTKTDTQVTINIKDADLNKSATVAETFDVEADYAGEKITLKFAETDVNTGEFAAVVNITKTGDLKLTYVDTTTLDGLAKTVNHVDSLITKEVADAIKAAFEGTAVTDEQVELIKNAKGTKKASGNIFAHASSTVLGFDEKDAANGNLAKVALGTETEGQILVTKPFSEFKPENPEGEEDPANPSTVYVAALVEAPKDAVKATVIYQTPTGDRKVGTKNVAKVDGTYLHVANPEVVDESKSVVGFVQYLNLAAAKTGFTSDFTVVWFDADGNVVDKVETFTFKYEPKTTTPVGE